MSAPPTAPFIAVYEYESENDRNKGFGGKLAGQAFTPEQLSTVLDGAVGFLAFFAKGQELMRSYNDAIDYLK